MTIDYKSLLAKYIKLVEAEEGANFINRLYRDKRGLFVGYSDKVAFTDEELAALHECESITESN